MTVRYEVRFTGRVQGVGFRYQTCRVADRFDVTGWVRNEPDGSVLCVVEGPEEGELDRFVSAVTDAMEGRVAKTRIQRVAGTGEFAGFGVKT